MATKNPNRRKKPRTTHKDSKVKKQKPKSSGKEKGYDIEPIYIGEEDFPA